MNAEKLTGWINQGGLKRKMANLALWKTIPFNKPHGLFVEHVSKERSEITIPYKRNNKNHLNGLHACALATAGEFAAGLLLLQYFDFKSYRLIMQEMRVEYNYQGKMQAIAMFEANAVMKDPKTFEKIEADGKIFIACATPIHDVENNLLCTVHTNWQIKSWTKTSVSR